MTNWFHPEPMLVCRPALPKDTADVLELTSHIWEGRDYIPEVWSEWLADPAGLLVIAEWGGRVVGLIKLSLLGPGEGWLEGLRVHPDFEGRGFASHLLDYIEEAWREMGGSWLGLATASFRVKVQQMSTRRGFSKVGDFTPYSAPALVERPGISPLEISLPQMPVSASTGNSQNPIPDAFHLLVHEEVGEALERIRQSPAMDLAWGRMDLGWSWAPPTRDRLLEACDRSQAWWWGPGREGVFVAREDIDDGIRYLSLQLLACPLNALTPCLLDFRRLGGALGFTQVFWLAPMRPEAFQALNAAGYNRTWEDSVYLYEKELS